MDRRNFLRRGVLGASGAMAAGRIPNPESEPAPSPPPLSPEDMAAYLEKVDAGVERISQWRLSDSFPDFTFDSPRLESLGRSAMHALYMSGMFGDLPIENQVDSRMQDRLWAAQPVMDEALSGMEEFLAGQTPEQLSRVRATLRDKPEVLRTIIRTLDDESARSGVSEARRDQLRTMFNDVAWRLEKQPPALVVGEYRSKVKRATASDVESAARQRWLAARLEEKVFWQAQKSLHDRRISRGLKAMGIGTVLLLAGALLVSQGDHNNNDALMWIGLIPGITAGSIFFVVGLISLLMGAATPADAM